MKYHITEEIITLYILFVIFFRNEVMNFLIRHRSPFGVIRTLRLRRVSERSFGTIVEVKLFIRRNRNRVVQVRNAWACDWCFASRNAQNEVRASASARARLCERDFCAVIVVGKSNPPVGTFPSPLRTGPRWRNAEFRFLVQSARYAKKVATFILPSRRNETCRELAHDFIAP